MAQRPTPSQLLAGIIGLGLIGIGATRLTSCGVSSSSVAATNQAVQSLVVTTTPTAVVDGGCITCVARATEEARRGPANETGSGR